MSFRRTYAISALAFMPVMSLYAQVPPGTGAATQRFTNGTLIDANWYITSDTTGTADPNLFSGGSGYASIVTGSNLAPGWGTAIANTTWIAPVANQNVPVSTFTCCVGQTTYELTFNVANVSSYPGFTISLLSDNFANINLNGKPVLYPLTQEYLTVTTIAVSTGFIAGGNTIDFIVTNQGGSAGLDVGFTALAASTGPSSGPTSNPTTIGKNSAPGTRHLLSTDDPIDSASGQYYETQSEIELGGPMNLGFRRYYSSQLSNGYVASALGMNWMTNFDQVAVITGSNAQVLMFGGKVVSFTDVAGTWQLVSPKDIPYQFIQSGTKFLFMDPDSKLVYTFTTPGVLTASIVGALTSIADRNGNLITITQGASGPTQVFDGLGRTLAFTYTSGQLTQVVDQAARTLSFAYTSGLLTSVTDIYKQTTTYAYTTAGSATALMQHAQLPLGNIPASQTYDSQGRVLTQRIIPGNDGNAYTTALAYDGAGGTTITDGLGAVTKHVSNAAGNIVQMTDPLGGTAVITYDSQDRRTSITDKSGNKTSYAYDPASGLLSSITDALGNTTSLSYVAQVSGGFTFYPLQAISYPDGTSDKGTFDSNGNVLTATNRKAAITKYVYDASGRAISITDPDQHTATFVWNTDSTLASSADALGNKRTYTYDITKRVSTSVDPNGGTTGYVRDKSTRGPMVAIIPPVTRESTTVNGDQNREVASTVISTGGSFTSSYTATGQLASFTDPVQNVTSYVYDGGDRMKSITSPAGEVATYTWDSGNHVIAISDLSGPRNSYTYTAESKIATATDGSGRKASYAYDALGRLQAITTPGGNSYKAGYDKLGNVTSLTNPVGDVETLARDGSGAVISATMAGAITTTFTRDAIGKVTSFTTPNGNTWKIGYDALERPSKTTDPLGNSSTFSFTGSQITGATMPLGTLAITNDADGRITQRKFSDGTTINTAYDTDGQLISSDGVTIVRDAAMRPTSINGIAIALDADSRVSTLTYAAGKVVTYAYDKSGRVASVADWVGGKTTIGYDGAGRITSLTYPNGIATTYTYDSDGRLLTIAAGNLASIALTRDAAGKIISAIRNVPRIPVLQTGAQQFSYDAASQLTSATSDAMGRVTAQNGRKYAWNLASQLTGFLDGTNSGTFTYDGLGEMNSSTVTGVAQNFVFNYQANFPALSIVRQAGADLRYYVYLPSGLLLYSIEAADSSRHFYHFDEMGNTVMLTNDSAVMTDSYAITPYGENADHAGTTSNPFTWQGQFGVMQEGAGLYYLRSRHYDATAARFISRDSKITGDPRSAEPYTYARGNPLKYIDPLGSLSTDDLQDAQPLLVAVALGAFLNGPGYLIDVDFVTGVLENAISQRSCMDLCAAEGWELVAFVTANPDLSFTDLYALLTPPAPPPPPTPQPATWVISSSPAPVQAAAPVSAPATLAKLAADPDSLITQDGGGLLHQDGGGLLHQDGSTLIGNGGSTLIGNSGSTLIGNSGSTLIGNSGSTLIGNSGSTLIGNSGSTLIGNSGSTATAPLSGN